MENPSLSLQFLNAFKKQFQILNVNGEFQNAIRTISKMTTFYKDQLIPAIATELGLEMLEKEHLRVDYTLYKKGGHGYAVPHIFIESENNPKGDLPKEIYKLLSVNAALRVLLTRDSFRDDDQKQDTHWFYPFEDFKQFFSFGGEFVVLSAVWLNNSLTYECQIYDNNGMKKKGDFDIVF